MATRATYKIQAQTFYIHWDGYPQGAAVYFWNMYKALQTSKGGMAEAFLRGNDGAEFTASHDAHGDTEWRYTLTGDTLTVEKATFPDNAPVKWVRHWSGDWWQFVNGNAEALLAHCAEWMPLFKLPETCRFDYAAIKISAVKDGAALLADVKTASAELVAYIGQFPNMTGNIASIQSRLNRAVLALTEYGKQCPHPIKTVAA